MYNNVLILGGTGAMGHDLTRLLSKENVSVTVTSRKSRNSNHNNISYVKGNAKDINFLKKLLHQNTWKCIVDLMSYTTVEFSERVDLLLSSTSQYVFISSARVYAQSEKELTEESPRILDVCKDEKYLSTDEYAIAKARQENLLISQKCSNFTIVRPGLTYNTNRLQFAMGEKEDWLFRVLNGQSIIFPKDMENIKTSMTYGIDAAYAISKLIGNPKAIGETIQIATDQCMEWKEVLQIYNSVLTEMEGYGVKVYVPDNALDIAQYAGNYYQVKYARGIDRTFCADKLRATIGNFEFTPMEIGLKLSLEKFLKGDRIFGNINIRKLAYYDKIAKEYAPIATFPTLDKKIKYMVGRYTLYYCLINKFTHTD